MADVTYNEGYYIMANLGKGKAVLGVKATGVTSGETITTPFARCVAVVTSAAGAAATDDTNVTTSAGTVTITSATTCPTAFGAIIMGDLY